MVKEKRYDRISVVIYALMGCFLAANQSIVTNIAEALDLGDRELGYMVSALYLGSMAAVLFEGELASRIGKRKAAAFATFLMCVGFVPIIFSRDAWHVIIGFFIYGAGVGGYESINMSLVTDNRGEDSNRFLNLLQAIFSTGAVIMPLILAKVLKSNEFRPLFVFMFICYAAVFAYFFLDKRIDTFAVQDEVTEKGFSFVRLVKNKIMIVYMLAMFIYLGTETAVTYWIGSLYNHFDIGEFSAIGLSSYWFASIIGRLIGSRIKSARSLIIPCFSVAAVGILLVAVLPGAVLKTAAVVIAGIAFGPVYSGIIVLGEELFPENASASCSLMIFSAGLGGVIFQPFISLFISSGSPGIAYWIGGALCAVVAVLLFLAFRNMRDA